MAIPLTAREPIEFTPKALLGDAKRKDIKVIIRVPTMLERDRYGAALVRAGVVFYTQDQIRAFTMAGIQEIYPPENHEEYQALLEEYWQVVDEESRVNQLQGKKLIELYQRAKVQKKTPDPKVVQKELEKIKPAVVMDRQRRVKATGIAAEVASKNLSVRDALAALTEADSKRAYMNVKTFVIGWKGIEHEPETPGPNGLQEHEAEYLRLNIGEEAWDELSDYITTLQALTEDEEKNSDSPLENITDQTGSNPSEPSSVSSGDGTSTAGSSGKTRANGSRQTTGSSSNSTKS